MTIILIDLLKNSIWRLFNPFCRNLNKDIKCHSPDVIFYSNFYKIISITRNWIKTSNIIYLKKFIAENNEKYTKNELEK